MNCTIIGTNSSVPDYFDKQSIENVGFSFCFKVKFVIFFEKILPTLIFTEEMTLSMKTELVHALTSTFETHARQTESGVEFWPARDIQKRLG